MDYQTAEASRKPALRQREQFGLRCLTLALAGMLLGFSIGRTSAVGVVVHWIGGSGDWGHATNWDIGCVPNNAGDTNYAVFLDAGGTNLVVTLNQAVTVSNLVSFQTLQVSNVLTVMSVATNWGVLQVSSTVSGSLTVPSNGVMNWYSGTCIASGSLTVLSNGLLNLVGTGTKQLYGPLTNYGTVNWQGGAFSVYNLALYNFRGEVWNQAGGCLTAKATKC